jgi:hypothetical protein
MGLTGLPDGAATSRAFFFRLIPVSIELQGRIHGDLL